MGIESPNKNYGLQYVFNNVYSQGAAPLADGLAIRFTTESPENYVGPLEIDHNYLPNRFYLSSVYPNPFNPKTNFSLVMPNNSQVSIRIFDILGRQVHKLHHEYCLWDVIILLGMVRIPRGNALSSGTYFVLVKSNNHSEIQKLLMLK